MITIIVRDCNQISQSFYDSVINKLQLHRLTCSCKHSSCLNVHGYYRRTVRISDKRISLRICRVKCSVCGRTHALLLSSIVPYSQIALSVQHQIVASFENGTVPFIVCDEHPSVDENNVKAVVLRYRKHWRERLRSLSMSLSPLRRLLTDCFRNYFSQFMQIHRGCNLCFIDTT